jgi:predicted AlkP superfamily phosphohydrolase/phosphomutase
VQPGAEYDQVRAEIMRRLLTLRDPQTGEAVVESVHRREDLYSGPQLEHAPDIVFMPTRLEYFGFGEYEFGSHKIVEAMQRGISGTHRLNGVFIAYGAAVRPGVQVDCARLVDLAPTILRLMDEPIPAPMDGRVLDEVIVPGAHARPRARAAWQAGDADHGAAPVGLNDADRQLLADRLRSLGYVG